MHRTARAFSLFKCFPPFTFFRNKTKIVPVPLSRSSSSSTPPKEDFIADGGDVASISLQEWQGWGTSSQIPARVMEIVEDLKKLEKDMDEHMSFGGLGGKLQRSLKVQELKKLRATYQALGDSEKKLQFFSARQIACRLLGRRGYHCQKCWLTQQDCMCSKIIPCSLWPGMRFWLYMHPKDFLRPNNTGKVLWQIFGVQAATLCIYGIPEHEEIMWRAFEHAVMRGGNFRINSTAQTNADNPLNFILIDGTWNNSAAMVRRLKDHAKLAWGVEDIPCISLATLGVSSMHRLRPQPPWDRTCTAAAAVGLLSELHLHLEFSSIGLDKHAEAVENGLESLLDALTSRRRWLDGSITCRERHNTD